MEFLTIRYAIGNELSMAIAIVSLVLGFFFWLVPSESKIPKEKRLCVFLVCLLLSILVFWNYSEMKAYTKVPHVVNLRYNDALNRLGESFLAGSADSTESISADSEVTAQSVSSETILKKGTIIYLTVKAVETAQDDTPPSPPAGEPPQFHTEQAPVPPPQYENNTPDSTVVEEPGVDITPVDDDGEPVADPYLVDEGPYWDPSYSETDDEPPMSYEDLGIILDSWVVYSDGYYDDWTDTQFYGRGMFGTFHYTRALTDEELENWFHGTTIHSLSDEFYLEPDNYTVSLQSPDGYFYVEFADELPSGTYICEFGQWVNDIHLSFAIEFDL